MCVEEERRRLQQLLIWRRREMVMLRETICSMGPGNIIGYKISYTYLLFQCLGEDHRSRIQGSSANLFLHLRTRRGQSLDNPGTVLRYRKSQKRLRHSFELAGFFSSQKNTKAPQAAGKIHTDFEKGFIMAEVMKYDDFKAEGSEAAVKVRKAASARHLVVALTKLQ